MANAIFHEEATVTNFDMSEAAGGSRQVEVIHGDFICPDCGCYVTEIEIGIFFCKKCGIAHA
jgi:ribosomal protein L37AE/L43A